MNSKVTTDTSIDPTNPRGVSRKKMWLIFAILFLTGISLYGSIIYRIKTYGYTGIGQDQLAHPEDAKPAATQPAK